VTPEIAGPPSAPPALGPNPDRVYPPAFFRQRLEEESYRALRQHSIVSLILIEGHAVELAHGLRGSLRRMDVLGFWKNYLGVLLAESRREDSSPDFPERVSLQAQGILRVAGVLDTEWQEIHFGACLLPEQKSGKIDPENLLIVAEKALNESAHVHQPILYRGARRFVDTPRKEAPTPLVRYGDLHINREQHKAWLGTQTVKFLPKEYDLLQYLLKHEGKLVRRDSLCKAVWGYDYAGGSRTVDMHIAKLRKKIKTSRSLAIRTLKGEGYRLELNS
jgi:hypothetical protein